MTAERWSEAVAGGNTIRRSIIAGVYSAAGDGPEFWTRVFREDRAADYSGQPAVPPVCPIINTVQPPCAFSWRYRVYDDYEWESCGDRSVACDVDSESPRCLAHTAESLAAQDPYAGRQSGKIAFVGLSL